MPKYRVPVDELKKVKPTGSDKKGFKSYNIILPDNVVEVETHEEYAELKDYLVEEK